MTREQIKEFQRTHRDWNGKTLNDDGDIGPKTEWALAIARLEPWRQAIVFNATMHVGLVEWPGNRGPLPDFWNERCGAPLGSPYCSSFTSWCISVDGLPERKEASSIALGTMLRRATLILPGDVMWFRTGPNTGHIAPVIGAGPGEVACAEANHNNMIALVRRSTLKVSIVTPIPGFDMPSIPPNLPLVAPALLGTR